ncbi:nuclear transport factor 2 family protein [Streptomyces gilvus]|uniref:nuclear transport factor 2 family protein n=1 Tax=Streptomyces gilvus TaxID=2920937 RepID=UPI001F0EDBAD|nr:nuclear transport factor 2 family protein [Streptomyces sp. CME 23]MCH5677580.1 nuclear transport factor 2 family protein [Streptomyces sp. CME 23]
MTNTITGDPGPGLSEAASVDALRHADLLLRSQSQADRHIDIEITGDVDAILGTLTAQGPYAYTVNPTVESGRLRQHLVQTRTGIRQCYVDLHTGMGLRDWHSLSRVLAPWYTFHAGWATVEFMAEIAVRGATVSPGDLMDFEALVLFPTMGGTGITGELFWARVTEGASPRDGQSRHDLLRDLLADHDAYLDALGSADIEGVLAALAPDGQVGIRDYTSDTPGMTVELDGQEQLRAHLADFYGRYVPERIDLLQRHVEDWFVFAETRWTVASVADGSRFTFLVADYAEIGPDRKVIARLGHGTDPVPV